MPVTEEKAEAKTEAGAMDIGSDLKLPAYTVTEIMMDVENISVSEVMSVSRISVIDFMSSFEKFKVDKLSIDEAEDDIVFVLKSVLKILGL